MSELKLQGNYEWAENPSKLQRAKDEVAASGKKFKENEQEEAVLDVYRRLLGHVKGELPRGASGDTNLATKELLEAAREEGRAEGADIDLDKVKEDAREEGRAEGADIDLDKVKEDAREEGRNEVREDANKKIAELSAKIAELEAKLVENADKAPE